MVNRVALGAIGVRETRAAPQPQSAPKGEFAALLGNALGRSTGVRLSAHAQERLEARHITLGADGERRVSAALDDLAAKGGREALILMDNVALVANVPNRTVITALSAEDARANVFTNIDSAVVLPSQAEPSSSETANGPAPAREALTPPTDRRGVWL